MLLALGLLVLGRAQPQLIENGRMHMIDSLAPALDAIAWPMAAAEGALTRVQSYMSLQEENQRLRAGNAQLTQWQNALVALQNENRELRGLLHFKTEPNLAYISARVIADTGGPFVRGLIVTAGKLDGVREGMAAMTGDGLIGRVVEAGDWSSRVLLITDLNSRIPVTVAGSGDRAILAGDNSNQPKLLYLPHDAVLNPGARVITSGHGGIFPPGLPIGVVTESARGAYSVAPAADLGRINYVRLVDFSLKGGAFNTLETKRIEAEQKAAINSRIAQCLLLSRVRAAAESRFPPGAKCSNTGAMLTFLFQRLDSSARLTLPFAITLLFVLLGVRRMALAAFWRSGASAGPDGGLLLGDPPTRSVPARHGVSDRLAQRCFAFSAAGPVGACFCGSASAGVQSAPVFRRPFLFHDVVGLRADDPVVLLASEWALLSLWRWQMIPFMSVFMQAVIAIVIFPLPCWLLIRLQRGALSSG